MNHPRLIVGLFLAAVAAGDLVLMTVDFGINMHGATPGSAAVLASYFSQTSLIAIWLALGTARCYVRALGSLAVLVGLTVFFSFTVGRVDDDRFSVVFSAFIAAAVAVPLFAVRPLGVRVRWIPCNRMPGEAKSFRPPIQFTVRYLLGLTTLAALVLATLKSLMVYEVLPKELIANKFLWAYPAGRFVVACGAIWAVLGSRQVLLRAIAPLAASSVAHAGLIAADPTILVNNPPYFLLATFELVFLLLSLWVFRSAGYRLVFRPAN